MSSTVNHHHKVIIAGGGLSGITALIQLKRKLGIEDVVVYERGAELGGTWATNSYPGASSDIPISLYSLSFSPAKEFDSQWPSSPEILSYWNRVVKKYSVSSSLVYSHLITHAKFSRSTNVWTLTIKDLTNGEERKETCNVFISAVGALSSPADPPFDTTTFEGEIIHTGKWDNKLDLKGKNVVVLGNGCSAAQFVPAVIDQVSSLTQIARSSHSIVPPVAVPDNSWTNFIVRWIPGLFTIFRLGVFFLCESYFWMNQDNEKAKKGRVGMKKISDRYIEKTAPEKYWDTLKYDFEFGQKRRVIDFKGYTTALHSPKMTLLQPDTILSADKRTITTSNGVVIDDVDVVVLSTGFKVNDYLFPLRIENDQGGGLVERLKGNGVKTYLTSMVASYPNFFILMGPNSVTGHSSVLFNTECTVDMMIKLLRPVFTALSTTENVAPHGTLDDKSAAYSSALDDSEFSRSPLDEKFDFHRIPLPSTESTSTGAVAPSVEVTQEAEDEWYEGLRDEMSRKIWEGQKVSWYTDKEQGGKCTTLYPWSQVHFKNSTQKIPKERFVWSNC